MDENAIYVIGMAAGVVGGAIGARLAKAPVWKGAVLTAIASAVQFVIGELADIDQPLVYSLVFLAAVGLVGGRWGMRMTARQLSLIVIGGFLFGLLAAVVAAFILSPAPTS